MASVNRVILIGNLGRVSRSALDTAGQQTFDGYLAALRGYFEAMSLRSVEKAARRLAEAFRLLRRVAEPIEIPKKISAPWMPLFGRNAAFFHAGKVDARNHP